MEGNDRYAIMEDIMYSQEYWHSGLVTAHMTLEAKRRNTVYKGAKYTCSVCQMPSNADYKGTKYDMG